MLRILVIGATLLCVAGCVPFRTLPDTQPATIQQSVSAGDSVELVRNDGSQLRLKVESVTDTSLTGTTRSLRYEIPLSDIRSIGTRHVTTDPVWDTIASAFLIVIAAVALGGGS